jgi:hypothetical protein
VTRETWSTAAVAWFPFFCIVQQHTQDTELRDRGVCWQPRQETVAEERKKKLMVKEMEKTHQDQQQTTKLAR